MNQLFYKNRCKCKETLLSRKNPTKAKRVNKTKPAQYPDLSEVNTKTFQILYHDDLSWKMKRLLKSFQRKSLHYVMDDILSTVQLNVEQRDNLLAVLYSPVISLQNNSAVDFFDIWIHELYVNKPLKVNRFLTSKSGNFYQITIKVMYKKKKLRDVQKTLW